MPLLCQEISREVDYKCPFQASIPAQFLYLIEMRIMKTCIFILPLSGCLGDQPWMLGLSCRVTWRSGKGWNPREGNWWLPQKRRRPWLGQRMKSEIEMTQQNQGPREGAWKAFNVLLAVRVAQNRQGFKDCVWYVISLSLGTKHSVGLSFLFKSSFRAMWPPLIHGIHCMQSWGTSGLFDLGDMRNLGSNSSVWPLPKATGPLTHADPSIFLEAGMQPRRATDTMGSSEQSLSSCHLPKQSWAVNGLPRGPCSLVSAGSGRLVYSLQNPVPSVCETKMIAQLHRVIWEIQLKSQSHD